MFEICLHYSMYQDFCYPLLLSNSLLYECVTFDLSIYQSMGIWMVFGFGVLWIMLYAVKSKAELAGEFYKCHLDQVGYLHLFYLTWLWESSSLRVAVCMAYLSLPFYFEAVICLHGHLVVGIGLLSSLMVCLFSRVRIPFTLM